MKTLILNGSPRKNGDTASMIELLINHLDGEYRIIDTYHCNISPCVDCRFCWNHRGCSIDDDMTDLYSYIESCDNILIASPIFFSELSGSLLSVCSRFQRYFCSSHFQKESSIVKPKKGAVILVGGGDGNPQKPYDTAVCLLYHVNAVDVYPLVCSFNTNAMPAINDKNAVDSVIKISKFFNARG